MFGEFLYYLKVIPKNGNPELFLHGGFANAEEAEILRITKVISNFPNR